MHRTLRVTEATNFDTVYPLNVKHQQYVATSSSASQISWVVDSPATNLLLDSEAYVIYTVVVSGDPAAANPGDVEGMFEGEDTVVGVDVGTADTGATPSPFNNFRLALRQGFCVMNGIDTVECRLNQSFETTHPGNWNGEFTRFYATPEEINSICTMSGGELDSGNHSDRITDDFQPISQTEDIVALGVGDALITAFANAYEAVGLPLGGDTTLNARRSTPATGEFHNPGLEKRFHRLAMESRVAGSAFDAPALSGASRYNNAVTFTIAERIPIDPFTLWDRKDGNKRIPGIRRLELTYKFNPNAVNLILQGRGTGLNPTINYHSTSPTLRLKWIVAPQGFKTPLPVTLPYTHMEEWVLAGNLPAAGIVVATGAASSGLIEVEFTDLRFKDVPRQLMFYLKPLRSTATDSPLAAATEQHLEIANVQLSHTTAKGSLFNASSHELFVMYVKNSPVSTIRPFSYEKWRRRFCTVVLRPEDHGIQYVDPGGVIMDLKLQVQSHWVFPSVGRDLTYGPDEIATQYRLYMTAMFDWGLTISQTDTLLKPL